MTGRAEFPARGSARAHAATLPPLPLRLLLPLLSLPPLLAAASAAAPVRTPRERVALASLDLTVMKVQPAPGREAGATPGVSRSVDGGPLRIGGREYAE
ncbi:MAG: hypothetical protein IRZ00_20430, partial [Gemmatimonadetes bacterium]|nr:hypothetical protein [Gemmatimonadota bacterium]